MACLRLIGICNAIALAAVLNIGIVARVIAQTGDPATLVKEKLVSQIKVTKTAADRSDIVTAGDVVVLHKDGLMMCSTASSYAFSNEFSNGVLTANMNNRAKDAGISMIKSRIPFGGGGSIKDAVNNGCAKRKFVAGEKHWITDISIGKKNDAIVVTTYSDPYNDVRYYGEVTFPFPHGAPVPSPDDFAKTVAELITVQPPDAAADKSAKTDAPAHPAAAPPADNPAPATPMVAIAPPAPPADAPLPTIALGQTVDQVVAGFGQPARIAKPTAKRQIYFYKDMKVTFVNGKVSNIE